VQVSPSAADETIVTGTTTIAGDLSTTFANGTYVPGTQYTLISSSGTLSGTFANFFTTNVPYSFTPFLSYDAHDAFLTMYPVIDPRGGQIYANRTATVIGDERLIRNAVLDHLTGPSGSAPTDGIHVWGEGFTGYGKISSQTGLAPISHNHSGGIAGIDIGIDGGFRVGLAGAYTTSRTSIQAYDSRAHAHSGHVVGYASWTDGAISLRGGGELGWGRNDVVRYVPSLYETDRSSQPGHTAQAFADASYRITASDASFEPHADLVWVHASSGDFNETGGAFSGFSGSAASTSATYAILGVRAILADIPLGPVSVAPRFDLGWQHGFGLSHLGQSLTLHTTAQNYLIAGVPLDSNAAVAQGGVDVTFTPQLHLHLGYDVLSSSHVSDSTVTARMSLNL